MVAPGPDRPKFQLITNLKETTCVLSRCIWFLFEKSYQRSLSTPGEALGIPAYSTFGAPMVLVNDPIPWYRHGEELGCIRHAPRPGGLSWRVVDEIITMSPERFLHIDDHHSRFPISVVEDLSRSPLGAMSKYHTWDLHSGRAASWQRSRPQLHATPDDEITTPVI